VQGEVGAETVPGVDVAPAPVPGVRGDPGVVVEFGVDTVWPGVVLVGGACVVAVGGIPSVVPDGEFRVLVPLLSVPGPFAVPVLVPVPVPVPVPAGTQGIVVGVRGCDVVVVGVPGTVDGDCGVGAMVPDGVGACVPVGVGEVGAVDPGGAVAPDWLCAAAAIDTADARANALESVASLRFITSPLSEVSEPPTADGGPESRRSTRDASSPSSGLPQCG